MSKAKVKKDRVRLAPLDLVLARFKMTQLELSEALGRHKSVYSHWRGRYKGNIPSAAWDEIAAYANKHGHRITLEELRSGGYA